MIPEHLVFLDLETTGTAPLHDRIIEIGLCEVVGNEPAGEWSTLVNPERPFSPFIEQLTGIARTMVADAPTFADLAGELQERLAGKVLVAHNARFDYGFLKSEFRRLGIDFQEQVLCTVRLSRALFPQHSGHSLDALIARHGLGSGDRHRALGDARVVREFFGRVRDEVAPEALDRAIRSQLKQPSLPPHLPAGQLAGLPGTPGVYLLYGENDTVLYVGKSVDIRSRVLSHFSGDHRVHKGMRLSQQVRRVDWIETAGELGALLLEARLVKELAPVHNRRLRRTRDLFTLRLVPGGQGGPLPEVAALKELGGTAPDHFYGLFRSRNEAGKALRELIRDHGLCARVLGLERGTGACFGYQVKKCRGACVGEEPPALHQARLLQVLAGLKLRAWPFRAAVGIREVSPSGERMDIHVFDCWRHLGTADNDDRLREILEAAEPLPFDLDSYRILSRFLDNKAPRVEFLNLQRRPEAAGSWQSS